MSAYTQNLAPVIVAVRDLQTTVSEFNSGLQAPLRAAADAGESELAHAKATLESAATALRGAQEGLLLGASTKAEAKKARIALRSAQDQLEDLEIGISVIYQKASRNPGAELQPIAKHLQALAASAKDAKAVLAGKHETHGIVAPWMVDNVQGACGAALTETETLVEIATRLNGGTAPDALVASAGKFKTQLALLSKEAAMYSGAAAA